MPPGTRYLEFPCIQVVTRLCPNPWYTSYFQAFKSFRQRLERTYKRTRDPQLPSELKSATNRHHHLLATAKKKFYSSLVHSRSSKPRLLWQTINQLIHQNCSSILPNSLSSSSIAEFFLRRRNRSSFFSGKITTLCLSLQSLSSKTTIDSLPDIPYTTDDSPPSPPPASLSTFQLTSETEIFHLLQSLPNKQCKLDPIPSSLLKDCASILVPVIKK